ncbi:MAG TPA: helix-turn-helix domain-containing protein, partial [Thermoanaerobaculia bacterium]|nr:helix-turn-helix domain-containing protein [Thermoanaerobaculia bacterium]
MRLLRWIAGGWTQAKLAGESGVAKGSICRYERGQRTPSPRTMERLCEGTKVPYAVVEGVLRPALRQVLAAQAGAAGAGGSSRNAAEWTDELLRALAAIVRPLLALVVEDVLANACGPWRSDQAPLAADRRNAPELWDVLRDSTEKDRQLLLEDTREYRGWAVCELACEESRKAAPDSAARALEYAELAVEIARLPAGENDLFRQRLQGYAAAHLGNARRVHGDLRGAAEAFGCARALWKAGAPGDPGLLNEARVLSLEVSLRIEQGQCAVALDLLDQAEAVDRNGERRYLLINRGRALEHLGDYDGAIAALQRAAPLIDGKTEPRQLGVLQSNLIQNLCHLRRFAEAEALLPELRRLRERLGQDLELLRTRWLEGWVAAGLERREEAISALEHVSREFARRQIPFDAALAGLELAVLYLEEGRTAEVRRLAEELLAIFKAQQVHRHALAALTLFCQAARKETATVELARRLGDYFYRAQHNPEL